MRKQSEVPDINWDTCRNCVSSNDIGGSSPMQTEEKLRQNGERAAVETQRKF